jgi:uncharacterized protein involved in type VI secretion and phage assembly
MMHARSTEAERAADGFPRGLAFGVVVKNDGDPDGLGRIRVRLELHSEDQSSFWARIATPMAGNEVGFYTLPDVDDEVLVGFIAEDPSHPVILGGVWNANRLPPETNPADGTNDRRLLRSRNRHEISIDDAKDELEVKLQQGTRMFFSPDVALLEDANGNKVEITSQGAITIKASQSIKIEAPQIEIKATTAELNGSANCKVKGGLVEIN